MAIVVGLGVIASGCSTASVEPTVKVEFAHPVLPASARQPCADPVAIPDRDITQAEVPPLWIRDRSNLVACETRRAAAVAAVDGAAP